VTGRPNSPERVASSSLIAWEMEADAVRAEYRRRERAASGSGDAWLESRTAALRGIRETDDLRLPPRVEARARVTQASARVAARRRWGR
jgi:hypothetical protein